MIIISFLFHKKVAHSEQMSGAMKKTCVQNLHLVPRSIVEKIFILLRILNSPRVILKQVILVKGANDRNQKQLRPIVCCVSTLKRKTETKECTPSTQGFHNLLELLCDDSKSPCETNISHQIIANASQLRMKFKANTSNVHLHCASTKVVNMSCRHKIDAC